MNIKPILSAVEKAVQDGLRDAGRQMTKRARELAPEDRGDFKEKIAMRIDDLTLQVSAVDVDYPGQARELHENLQLHHPGSGGPKFLETANDETDAAAAIAKRLGQALGG